MLQYNLASSSLRCLGARPWIALKVISKILKCMRYLTGSQCSFTKVGVIWSNLLLLQTSLAAVFCTLWSFCSSISGIFSIRIKYYYNSQVDLSLSIERNYCHYWVCTRVWKDIICYTGDHIASWRGRVGQLAFMLLFLQKKNPEMLNSIRNKTHLGADYMALFQPRSLTQLC